MSARIELGASPSPPWTTPPPTGLFVRRRDCILRNSLRQGIHMDGSPGSQNYLVTGSRDLEQPVQPGGSTTHAEHARGLTNVIIENNECRKSIFAGGVDGMIIRGNTVEDRTVCNSCTNLLIADNSVRSNANPGDLVEPGYTRGLPVRGNTVLGAETNPIGLYVWGARVTTASLAWMY